MIVTIDGINREEKETQYGVKSRVGLKIVESEVFDVNGTKIEVQDRWFNGMLSPTNNGTENWSKGDKVNIAIKEKEGKYLNFTVVRDGSTPVKSTSNPDLSDILRRLETVEKALEDLKPQEVIDPTDDF